MRAFSTTRFWATVLVFAGALACAGSAAQAQFVPPHWDHYWVYDAWPSPPSPLPVTLTDQFGTWTHQVGSLRHFANPTVKVHGPVTSPINDPSLHYTWWQIEPYPANHLPVVVMNQFGPQTLGIGGAQYLLNPARKNEPGPPPSANHYKCYECFGSPVNVPVHLADQFGQREAMVMTPRLLCNPVAKTTAQGVFYPILDPLQHYVCYEIEPMSLFYSASVTDQFVSSWQLAPIGQDRYLAVPTDKHDPTPASPSTWGRLKTLYR